MQAPTVDSICEDKAHGVTSVPGPVLGYLGAS